MYDCGFSVVARCHMSGACTCRTFTTGDNISMESIDLPLGAEAFVMIMAVSGGAVAIGLFPVPRW